MKQPDSELLRAGHELEFALDAADEFPVVAQIGQFRADLDARVLAE